MKQLIENGIISQQLSLTGTVPVTIPHYFPVHKRHSTVFSTVRIVKLLIS